ncbi:MAG: class B sortase [Clostridia bacterium]|nr:class B sortase [Clostridia bacterium]
MDDNTKKEQSEEDISVLSEEERPSEDISENNEDDIHQTSENPKNQIRSKAANIFQISLICLFGGVFLVCAVYLAINYIGKIQGGQIYEGIAGEYSVFDPTATVTSDGSIPHILPSSDAPMQTLEKRMTSGTTDSQTGSSDDSDKLAQVRSSLKALKEKNPDVYGWIFVSDSDINYPIVQGSDNQYYLNHSIEKKYLAIGTIFADSNCKEKITDNYNTVFYGHNVVTDRKGSSMFHDVTKFLDKDYFDNTVIYVYTMDGIYVYKPFSIYGTTSDHFYFTTTFTGETEFLQFAAKVKALSSFQNDVTVKEGDTMITLSTCTNGPQNARYALHAVLVDHITDEPTEDSDDTE